METTIGACGLICSECEAFSATRTYDAAAIAAVAKKWSEWNGVEIKPDGVWCTGCQSAGERKGHWCGQMCPVRACAREKGHSTCAGCDDYPCPKLEKAFFFAPADSPARTVLDALRRVCQKEQRH